MSQPVSSRRAARSDIRIAEHQRHVAPSDALTDADLARLASPQLARVLTLRQTPTGWEITVGATVGVLLLDHVRLIIEPKFAFDPEQLLAWVAFAAGARREVVEAQRRWSTAPDGLADLVIHALIAECQSLLRGGLRRDYTRQHRVEPILRGRLDIRAQVSRRYGRVDQLHLTTFDRTTDTWENRVCAVALRKAARLATDTSAARAAVNLADAFSTKPTQLAEAVRMLTIGRYHRMNTHYRPAHTWANLLLQGGGVTDLLTDTGTWADSLLINMNRVWEESVRRLTTEAAPTIGGTAVRPTGPLGIRVTGEAETTTFAVDAAIQLPDGQIRPIDAKYKRYDQHPVGSNDMHQLLTYATAYAGEHQAHAVIVHPSRHGTTTKHIAVSGPYGIVGRVYVHGVDVTQHPHECGAAWDEMLVEMNQA